jgi:hypothetical protein
MRKLLKKNILKYKSPHEESLNTVSTLSVHLPQWYKNIPQWKDNDFNRFPKSKTVKKCVPFLDSMLVGYALTLPGDLFVNFSADQALTWSTHYSLATYRHENLNKTLPVPSGCAPFEFTWVFPAFVKIPKNYSAIITHPFNRHDLPFITTTGIVDGEFVLNSGSNLPFYMKEDFTGVIPKGTPIAQIIPFKRELWKLQEDSAIEQEGILYNKKSSASTFTAWYKTEIWKKKTFE